MVRDYVEGYYVKAHAQFRALDEDNAHRARELSAAIDRIRREWPEVWVAGVEDGPADTISVTRAMPVRAKVHLGRLSPPDVVVELYVGRVDMQGDLVEGESVVMRSSSRDSHGNYGYEVETSIVKSGLHGFTVRVRPNHPDMSSTFIPGLICWADAARIPAMAAAL
jgi:starch phosphorylase